MTTTYTGVSPGATFTNATPGPSPGEQVTAAGVGLVAQDTANKLKRIEDRFVNGEDGNPGDSWDGALTFGNVQRMATAGDVVIDQDVKVNGSGGVISNQWAYKDAQSFVRKINTTPLNVGFADGYDGAPGWIPRGDGYAEWFTNSTGAYPMTVEGPALKIPIDGDHENLITKVRLYVKAHSGHGALPTHKMKATLFEYDGTAGAAATTIKAVEDPAADVAAYEDSHYIDVIPDDPLEIDAVNNSYWIVLEGEWEPGATNVEGGASYLGGKIFYDRATVVAR